MTKGERKQITINLLNDYISELTAHPSMEVLNLLKGALKMAEVTEILNKWEIIDYTQKMVTLSIGRIS